MEGGAALRGPVDTRASVNYENFNMRLDMSPTDRVSAFARAGYFAEDRLNGKVDETNDTAWKHISGGARVRLADGSDIQGRAWGNFERFHSRFFAITSPGGVSRSGSRLTLRQRVPTSDTGGMVQWAKALGSRSFVTVGTDWRWVDGDSLEEAMQFANPAAVQTFRVSGGTQKSVGVFIQDIISVTDRFQLTLSARLDHWRNYDSHNLETSAITGQPLATNAPSCEAEPTNANCLRSKKNTIGSPKLGAVYHVNEKLSIWNSVSWGFRAPTLNELYRQFRVGSVLTLANPELGPERLVAGEGGINYSPIPNLTWRSSGFVNRFSNPVSNVTISSTPALDTRQRQNLNLTRIWGIQSSVDYRLQTNWKFEAAYLYNVAEVRESRVDAAGNSLAGKVLAEVPRHRGSAQVAYSHPRYITASASVQVVGGQYDDDLNETWLPYYSLMEINASRRITRNVEVFFGIQNLLDRTFYVQRNPTTVGAPRFFSGGLEISWNGR
jgi:outer membrane receptor protein involved in Fe transport